MADSTATAAEAGASATAAPSAQASTPQIVEQSPPEAQRTPFASPASSISIPDAQPLTTEQTTAYNSLLNTVSTWTSIGETSDVKSEHTSLADNELMWLTRECLLRYLRASKWNVATAQTRVLNTLLWRREYGVVSARPQANEPKITVDYISIENETGKQWILGYDNAGRPCHYLNPSRQNTKRSERQIEHLVFMLERAIDLMPAGQETLALLINFAETSSGQGATVSQGKQTLNILQNHYPERLGRALLCNLPWHIWAFMKVITPFIDPVTRSKIVYDQPLEKHVPPEQLLKSHGGTLDTFEYEHAKYWPALNAMAAERRKSMHDRWVAGGRRVGESELYLKGGTDVSLAQEENGRLSREKDSLPRGRTLQVGSDQKRDKSVSILADGEEPAKQDSTEKEGSEKKETADDKTEKEDEVKADGGVTADGGTGLEKKIGDLKVEENGSAPNGAPKTTAV